MGLLDIMQKGCERFSELAESREPVSRREFSKKAGKAGIKGTVLLTCLGIAGAAYANAVPKDLYSPKAPEVSEARFKQTIAKESADGQYVWVQYTFKPDENSIYDKRGDAFWDILKHEIPNAKYMTIDTTTWRKNDGINESIKEIGSNDFPGFVLYRDGKVVQAKDGYLVQIQGPPKDDLKIKEWTCWLTTDVFYK